MLATTLAALLTAFIRFATERYWVPLKVPQRLVLTVLVGGLSVLLLGQALGQAQEHGAITASQDAKSFPEQIANWNGPWNWSRTIQKQPPRLGNSSTTCDGIALRAKRTTSTSRLMAEKGDPLNLTMPIHARLGMTLDQLNQSEEAEEMFAKAEQLDPNGYMTVAYIAWHKMHIKDYAAAKRTLSGSRRSMTRPRRK